MSNSQSTALDGIISISPETRGGRPCVTSTRIAVDDVVLMHRRLGMSLEEIGAKYDLSMAQLHAAMSYYFNHRDETDKRMAEDEALFDELKRNNPSPLREKLRALSRA